MSRHFDSYSKFIEFEAKKVIKGLFQSLPNLNYKIADSIFCEALSILKTHRLGESESSFEERISESK